MDKALRQSRRGGRGGREVVVASPTGATVFVTGYSLDADGVSSSVTIAYAAATGAQRWLSRYSSGGQGSQANSLALDPPARWCSSPAPAMGPTALTTPPSPTMPPPAPGHGSAATTVPAAVTTLPRRWPSALPGERVFVTGSSTRADGSGNDYATAAYNATTGARLWVTRYGSPASDNDAIAVAVSPSGGGVLVTGSSYRSGQYDYATVGYNAVTGAQAWARRYNGPGNGDDLPTAMASSPNGRKVFVTGYSVGTAG